MHSRSPYGSLIALLGLVWVAPCMRRKERLCPRLPCGSHGSCQGHVPPVVLPTFAGCHPSEEPQHTPMTPYQTAPQGDPQYLASPECRRYWVCRFNRCAITFLTSRALAPFPVPHPFLPTPWGHSRAVFAMLCAGIRGRFCCVAPLGWFAHGWSETVWTWETSFPSPIPYTPGLCSGAPCS